MPVVHTGSIFVGNSSSTAHQIWSGANPGRFGFEYQDITKRDVKYRVPAWTWSGFEMDGTPNSVKFTPDPINGGLQGDFSYGTGSISSYYPNAVNTYEGDCMELDPAGGILTFSMLSREYSYWHKIGPVMQIDNFTQKGNEMNIGEFQTYFLSNSSQYTYAQEKRATNLSDLYYNSVRNCYSNFTTFKPLKSDTATTWQPSKSNKSDLTFSCYVGPNNTPYSAYTNIYVIGFWNEVENGEWYGSDIPSFAPKSTYFFNRPVNSPNVANTTTYLDWRQKGYPSKIDNLHIISFWQKPNVLYYVHMLWVNPLYTDYDNPPINSAMATWTTTWDVEQQDMLLYVEFGISPDGGKNIFWNNAKGTGTIGTAIQKVYDGGITATVPIDIHKCIKPSIVSSSVNRQSVTPYTVSSVSTCSCKSTTPFKFVKMRVSLSSKNDEHNNLSANRFQKYAILNYEQLDGNVKTTQTEDPNNYGLHYAKYGSTGTTYFKYQIGRKYKTNDWNLQMSASLYYESGSMRYEGNTDIHKL